MRDNSTDEPQLAEKRRNIDPVFKEMLTRQFGQLDIPLQTQVEVSRLPRTMDALVLLLRNEDLEKARVQTPFPHFQAHNQVEYKGIRDPLTIEGYHLIRGRTHLYMGEQSVSPSQMTVTIVCSRKPRNVLYHSKDHVVFEKVDKAYYVSDGKPPVYILAINELPMIPQNYPFLVFTSSENNFRQFLRKTFEERTFQYVRYAYAVRPKITKEELAMARRHYRLSEEELEFIKNDIGQELLSFYSTEDRLHGLSPEERLRGLNANELRKLKQLLENLENPPEREAKN